MEEKDLNDILCKFWFEARTAEGDYYKATSHGSLHYGINRMLHSRGYEYSIIHDSSFKESTEAYKDALKELKALGYGHIESYKEIKSSGKPQKILKRNSFITQQMSIKLYDPNVNQ